MRDGVAMSNSVSSSSTSEPGVESNRRRSLRAIGKDHTASTLRRAPFVHNRSAPCMDKPLGNVKELRTAPCPMGIPPSTNAGTQSTAHPGSTQQRVAQLNRGSGYYMAGKTD